jgi:hypothetical protein
LGAQASTVWVGSPAGKDVLEVVQAKRRGGEKTTLRVGYATEPGDYGRITLTGEGPVDATDTISQRACDLVLRLLEYKGEARTKEIIESIDRDGINLQATKRALKFLVSVGKLTKPMRGCYRIAENAEGTDNDAE